MTSKEKFEKFVERELEVRLEHRKGNGFSDGAYECWPLIEMLLEGLEYYSDPQDYEDRGMGIMVDAETANQTLQKFEKALEGNDGL